MSCFCALTKNDPEKEKEMQKEKDMQKSKMAVWEAFQIAVKRREVKGKGEKESYIHLNAEFQSIARRDKKAFLSDQCKEIKENNRTGKSISDTKGTFHAKMGSIKDRNSKDIKEAEEISKRWQEYTELYRKGLNDLNNDNDVVTHHLEPEILECKVK